jgi:hypothetical protein
VENVETSTNFGIINSITKLHLVGISTESTLHTLFYLKTALHVPGGTITHHQERKQLHLQHLVFVTPLLLSAAIVEDTTDATQSTFRPVPTFPQ